MFGKRIPLFKLFGFSVNIDISWFILAILIVWSLAKGLFPYYFKGFSNATYWWMGVGGAIGLFLSIIFHEFCHSLVARHYGLPMKGITLFIFGGVAEMEDEPPSAKSEFLMAIAGPISSVVLGIILYFAKTGLALTQWSAPTSLTLQYLAWLNFILAGFNLIPAFPLDGGRVLRSILWSIKDNIQWATRIASKLGAGFGIFLIVAGVFSIISGNLIGGIWWILIGMFIKNASQMSYNQLLIRRGLEGENVRHFMKTDPITVPPTITIKQLVDDYFYKYHYKMFPVSADSKLAGCITINQIKDVPKDQWQYHAVGELVKQCSIDTVVSPDTAAMKALSKMNTTGNTRLLVVEDDKLVGVVSLKDMLKFLSLKIDLEGDES